MAGAVVKVAAKTVRDRSGRIAAARVFGANVPSAGPDPAGRDSRAQRVLRQGRHAVGAVGGKDVLGG